MSTHPASGFDLRLALDHGNHITSHGLGHVHKHKANRAAANYRYGVPNFHTALVKPAQYTGQGLDHCGLFEADVRRNGEHVQFDDAARDPDVLAVGAVVE